MSRSSRTLFTVTRGDYVFARVLLVVATLALVAGSLIRLWPTGSVHFRGAVAGTGPEYVDPAVTETAIATGASAWFSPELDWVVSDTTVGQRLVAGAPTALILLFGIGVAWSLWQLLTAAGNEPFTRRTLKYARLLAGLVLAVAVLAPFAEMAAHFYLIAQLSAEPQVLMTFRLSDFLPVVVGALLVVLTEVYARGLALRDDTEGLV